MNSNFMLQENSSSTNSTSSNANKDFGETEMYYCIFGTLVLLFLLYLSKLWGDQRKALGSHTHHGHGNKGALKNTLQEDLLDKQSFDGRSSL